MIQRKVSAVLLVRDGFTGRPFLSGSALLCRLDGQVVRPIFKDGGYLVLTDLYPGEYALTLAARGFLPETVALNVGGRGPQELEIGMRPGPGYALPPDAVRLHLELSDSNGVMAGEEFWAGSPLSMQVRLMQNTVGENSAKSKKSKVSAKSTKSKEPTESTKSKEPTEPAKSAESAKSLETVGEQRKQKILRIFCSGPASLLPVPGHFLLLDKKKPELVHILFLRDGMGETDEPVQEDHPRGTHLVPVQRYRTDEAGQAELWFPTGGTVTLFCRAQQRDVALQAGAKEEISWQIP